MPDGDILIHTGDFTDQGTDDEVADFNDWMGELSKRYRHRIVIFGNHEYKGLTEDAKSAKEFLNPDRAKQLVPNATVLEHETVNVLGLRIFGSSWCPWHQSSSPGDEVAKGRKYQIVGNLWHASCERKEEHRFGEIPEGIDILLTHGAPYGIMDNIEIDAGHWGGSKALRDAIMRVCPRVHLFGHIHEQRGVWYHQSGKPFEGGIEYELQDGEMHPTWSPPPSDYPCQLICCNAMKNHPGIDSRVGKSGESYLAGPARLIIAEKVEESWSFRVAEAE